MSVSGPWLRIELDHGNGWQVEAEGEAPMDVTLPEVIATMESYAGDAEARALVNGEVVVSTAPVHELAQS